MAVAVVTTAVLPLRTAAVAMKTPAATAIAGAQTINNQQSTKSSAGDSNRKGNDDSDHNDDGNEGDDGGSGSAATARGRRPAQRQRRQLGKCVALAMAASLETEAAA